MAEIVVHCSLEDWMQHGPALVRAGATAVSIGNRKPRRSILEGEHCVQFRAFPDDEWKTPEHRGDGIPELLLHYVPEKAINVMVKLGTEQRNPGVYDPVASCVKVLNHAACLWASAQGPESELMSRVAAHLRSTSLPGSDAALLADEVEGIPEGEPDA